MDVVRRNIQKLGGRILINSERGKGMTIQFALPLTLAVLDGMVIKAAQETYVMPMASIVECLRPSNADLHHLHGTAGMLQLRGELLPLVQLSTLLDLGNASAKSEEAVVMITDAGDGQLSGSSRHRRGDHPRQWSCRVHSGCRTTLRARRGTAICRVAQHESRGSVR
jgi:two-component system chemotaxis sensor kinase CheA